jgi:NAD(P)-dependent dehydrogenase (short-subunit alcohol dehydrogenase family)
MLITGSSRGLGRALAEAVLAGGHKLAATARHLAQLARTIPTNVHCLISQPLKLHFTLNHYTI